MIRPSWEYTCASRDWKPVEGIYVGKAQASAELVSGRSAHPLRSSRARHGHCKTDQLDLTKPSCRSKM
eukprot:1185113-Prorocentrum_minimum.AAC.4